MKHIRKLITELREKAEALEEALDTHEQHSSIPSHTIGTFNMIKQGKATVGSMTKKLNKSQKTIYTEISSIRKAGYTVSKEYNKRKRTHEYRLEL